MVRLGTANPPTPVRFRPVPPRFPPDESPRDPRLHLKNGIVMGDRGSGSQNFHSNDMPPKAAPINMFNLQWRRTFDNHKAAKNLVSSKLTPLPCAAMAELVDAQR